MSGHKRRGDPKRKTNAPRSNARGGRSADGVVHAFRDQAGDRVVSGNWAGTEVKLNGEEFMLMKESDLTGVLDQPAADRRPA
jgi:chaperonin GroES